MATVVIVGETTKAPADVIDAAITWTLPTGDSVETCEWSVTGGIELGTGGQAPTISGNTTIAWALGGADTDRGLLVAKVTTADGRVATRGIRINVREVE